MDIAAMITKLFVKNGMIFAFMLLGIIMFVAYKLGGLTKGPGTWQCHRYFPGPGTGLHRRRYHRRQ